MARKYTYETTLNLPHFGERDVRVRYEFPDFAYVEGIEVLAIEGITAPFNAELVDEIELHLTPDLHNDAMMQKAYVEDAERRIEVEERIQERKAELAGEQ